MANDEKKDEAWTEAFRSVLDNTPGEDSTREGLLETPVRAAKAMGYLTSGYQQSPQEIMRGAIFQSDSNEMVVARDIDVYSLCEHHLLPFLGKVHIAYIPHNGRVVGLSKLPRIVDVFARRFQMQERLTQQVGQSLDESLGTRGVAVLMECRHLCMEMRGVERTNAATVTRFRSGSFEDPTAWMEFMASISRVDTSVEACLDAATVCVPCTYTPSSSSRENPSSADNENESGSSLPSANLHQSNSVAEAYNYRFYQSRASGEFDIIVSILMNAMRGPFLDKKKDLSVMDIGAGNGPLIERLVSQLPIREYKAFEQNQSLYEELCAVVERLGLRREGRVMNETFSPETNAEVEVGTVDIILLSHCLYYSESKNDLVDQALKFLAPGGLLCVFHQWKPGGTLETLSKWLTSKSLPHQMQLYNAKLDLQGLSIQEKAWIAQYSRGRLCDKEESMVVKQGCILLESLFGQQSTRKLSFEARRKTPAAIVSPGTVVGIQSCLRSASLGLYSGNVTVVGGGHSANCLTHDGIAIDLQRWNKVEVNTDTNHVRVGGGATIGMITLECEKHGLLVPLGDRPSVGMGLVLQGGINHFMRRFGMACDQIIGVVYISPKGELVETSKPEDDLFLFRGAGTNFGVVIEMTLQAYTVATVLTQTTDYLLYPATTPAAKSILSEYSEAATRLPKHQSLDGFLYWANQDTLAFSSCSFDTDPGASTGGTAGQNPSSLDELLQGGSYQQQKEGPVVECKPSELFDKELYMSARFNPSRVTEAGQEVPVKLRSLKRCLFLPKLNEFLASLLMEMVQSWAPTKWSYIHFLHGGGSVPDRKINTSAFGCRSWSFAAVFTGRFPDGNAKLEKATAAWLNRIVQELQPHMVGVYGADLGPQDSILAQGAFGEHRHRLAQEKRQRDPCHILRHTCPLLLDDRNLNGFQPSRSHHFPSAGVVIVFCGRRWSGKDWLAQVVHKVLVEQIGLNDVTLASVSEGTKRAFCRAHSQVDLDKLLHDRDYKERYRSALLDYYNTQCFVNPAFDATCYLQMVEQGCLGSGHILLLTGLRAGLADARRLAGEDRLVIMVKVEATLSARLARGMVPNAAIDESLSERSADIAPPTTWDVVYSNHADSTESRAVTWTMVNLLPLLLQRTVRQIPDTPRPGIVYKDLVGGIVRQSFGLTLTTLLWEHVISRENVAVDAIVTAESTGFLFAAPLAAKLQVPLIVMRKGKANDRSRLPSKVSRIAYDGSNIQGLSTKEIEDEITSSANTTAPSSTCLDMMQGSLTPDQRVVVVDDCLASGATAAAVTTLLRTTTKVHVTALLCVATLPDLGGQQLLQQEHGIQVYSLMEFEGQ